MPTRLFSYLYWRKLNMTVSGLLLFFCLAQTVLAQTPAGSTSEAKKEVDELIAKFDGLTDANAKEYAAKLIRVAAALERNKETRDLGYALGYAAMALERAGEVEAALMNYEAATTIFVSLNIKQSAGQNLRSSARLLAGRRDYVKAIAHLRQAEPLLADSEWAPKVLKQLGDVLWDSGDAKSAVSTYERAIKLFKIPDQAHDLADTYVSLGLLYSSLDNYEPAIANLEKAAEEFKKLDTTGPRAEVQWYLAIIYTKTGKKERSWQSYKEAIKLFSESGQKLKVTNALNGLGASLADSGQHQKAVEVFVKAVDSCKATCDDNLRATILFNLGNSYVELKRAPEGVPLIRESIEIFRKVGNKLGLANALNMVGFVLGESGNHTAAIEVQAESASIFRELSNIPGLAKVLFNLGVNYSSLKQAQKALDSFTGVLEIVRATGHQFREGEVLFQIGLQHDALGNKQRALGSFIQALAIQRKNGDKTGEGDTLAQMAILYEVIGDRTKAIESFETALRIAEGTKSASRISEIQGGLTLMYTNAGDYRKAMEIGHRALQAVRSRNEKQGIATMLFLLGSIHTIKSEYTEAMKVLNESLEITKGSGWKTGEATALLQLGQTYLQLGDFDKAVAYTTQSITLASESKNQSQIAVGTNNLALVHISKKEYEKGLEYAKRALDLQKKVGFKRGELVAENNIANAYWGLKRYDEGRASLLRSLALARLIGDRNGEAMVLLNLGALDTEIKNFSESIQELNKALLLARELGDRRIEAYILGSLADYWRKQNRPEVAVFFGKEAVNIIQGIRASLTGIEKDTQGSFIKQFEEGYRDFATLLIDLGRISEAEKVLAMLKEQEYFDFVRRDGDVVDDLLAKVGLTPQEEKAFLEYKKYADRLTQLGRELGELQIESRQFEIGKFPKQARLEELEQQMANANKVFLAFLDQLKTVFGPQDARVAAVDSGTQALLKGLGEPQTAIVSTISGQDRLSIILTTADVQKAYSVKATNVEVNRLVGAFKVALRSRSDLATKDAGKKLFDMLLPAELIRDLENVRADTILWSLDGTLRYVPMNALWDGERYLIERFNSVVLTLASRDKLSIPSADRKNWLALGAGVTKAATVDETDGSKRSFAALPAVANEICGLISDPAKSSSCGTPPSSEKGVMNGRMMIDEEFTLRNFKNSIGRFPVIHIASHFHLNSGNENDSYLLLGGGDENRLTLADIRRAGTQFVGVELLTLSACNTGTLIERGSSGVEIEGFGALAQRSGAKTVVASLWAVADNSTKELMVTFYRNLLINGSERKGESLRKAQLSLLRGEKEARYSHPYYWAPFVLIGNWR